MTDNNGTPRITWLEFFDEKFDLIKERVSGVEATIEKREEKCEQCRANQEQLRSNVETRLVKRIRVLEDCHLVMKTERRMQAIIWGALSGVVVGIVITVLTKILGV